MTKKPEEYWEYKCIDGNWTKRPVAYCTYKKGVLTEGLMKTHRCRERQCKRLRDNIDFEKEPE